MPSHVPLAFAGMMSVSSISYGSSMFSKLSWKTHSYSWANTSLSGHSLCKASRSTLRPASMASCIVVDWAYHDGSFWAAFHMS